MCRRNETSRDILARLFNPSLVFDGFQSVEVELAEFRRLVQLLQSCVDAAGGSLLCQYARDGPCVDGQPAPRIVHGKANDGDGPHGKHAAREIVVTVAGAPVQNHRKEEEGAEVEAGIDEDNLPVLCLFVVAGVVRVPGLGHDAVVGRVEDEAHLVASLQVEWDAADGERGGDAVTRLIVLKALSSRSEELLSRL